MRVCWEEGGGVWGKGDMRKGGVVAEWLRRVVRDVRGLAVLFILYLGEFVHNLVRTVSFRCHRIFNVRKPLMPRTHGQRLTTDVIFRATRR